MENKFYFDRPETRAKILDLGTEIVIEIDKKTKKPKSPKKQFKDSWQEFPTPLWVAEEIINLIQDDPELLYVVLFNVEFLEELIYKKCIEPKRIMFMADNGYKAAIAMGLYGVKTFELPSNIRDPEIAIEKTSEKIRKAFYNGDTMPKTNNIIVFGNPPYQSEDGGSKGGKSAVPLYHHFVEAIIDKISPRYFSFIIPSRWMAGGKGLDNHRARMKKDNHLKVIRHFPGNSEVFKDVIIPGGVNYFLWDRDYKGLCDFNGIKRDLNKYDIVVSDNKAVSIVDKMLKLHKNSFINSICLERKPFNIASDFDDWKSSGVLCYSIGNEKKYVDPNAFSDDNNIQGLWKVCIGKANGAAQIEDKKGAKRVLGEPFLIEPGAICTETFIVINSFNTQKEANNFIEYIKTKFFKFMLGIRLVTQNISRDKFTWVPDLGPYNKVWTDADLYKRFKLTPKEIAYIESKIKPIG